MSALGGGMSEIDSVILIHGFRGHGVTMALVRRHLENEYAMKGELYTYPSVTASLDENADLLERFIREKQLERSHIVAHSLGGVVSLRMLSRDRIDFQGRVVCMGSPLSGSRAATFLSTKNWAEQILGKTLPEGTVHSIANDWAGEACEKHDVGVIAGSIPVGIGQLTGSFKEPSDGTVAVSETQLIGARDHVVLPVSHFGMLISRSAADQAGAFLKRGEFLRAS